MPFLDTIHLPQLFSRRPPPLHLQSMDETALFSGYKNKRTKGHKGEKRAEPRGRKERRGPPGLPQDLPSIHLRLVLGGGVYDQRRKTREEQSQRVIKSSLLSGSSGSPEGSKQHVGVMNATFSAPCTLVPIDSCHLGAHNPVFLQQASCVTGGVYVKSQHVSFVNHRPSISFAPVVAVQWRICSISAASQQQQCSRPEERGENTKNRRRNHRTGWKTGGNHRTEGEATNDGKKKKRVKKNQ